MFSWFTTYPDTSASTVQPKIVASKEKSLLEIDRSLNPISEGEERDEEVLYSDKSEIPEGVEVEYVEIKKEPDASIWGFFNYMVSGEGDETEDTGDEISSIGSVPTDLPVPSSSSTSTVVSAPTGPPSEISGGGVISLVAEFISEAPRPDTELVTEASAPVTKALSPAAIVPRVTTVVPQLVLPEAETSVASIAEEVSLSSRTIVQESTQTPQMESDVPSVNDEEPVLQDDVSPWNVLSETIRRTVSPVSHERLGGTSRAPVREHSIVTPEEERVESLEESPCRRHSVEEPRELVFLPGIPMESAPEAKVSVREMSFSTQVRAGCSSAANSSTTSSSVISYVSLNGACVMCGGHRSRRREALAVPTRDGFRLFHNRHRSMSV